LALFGLKGWRGEKVQNKRSPTLTLDILQEVRGEADRPELKPSWSEKNKERQAILHEAGEEEKTADES